MAKNQHHEWYKQYLKLKTQYPDTILLYRMGEFYETFDDDAKLVAELLEVVLSRKEYATERATGKKAQKLVCPMAGIPFHAAENYVARLVNQGYRVAIAEQLSETPSSKNDTRPRSVFASGLEQTGRQRGLVHREIVRVLTPGTVIDPGMLQATRNNYLVAVLAEGDHIGLSYADLSTGEFAATEFSGEGATVQLAGELSRLMASEILVSSDEACRPPGLAPSSSGLSQDMEPMTKDERETLLPHERVARRLDQENMTRWTHGNITAVADWRWDESTARDMLLQHFGTQSLAGFGLDDRPQAMRAAGVVLQYINETQRSSAAQITTLRAYTTGAFMLLDPQTRRNLELLEGSSGKAAGSLVGVLDTTRTPMGARLIRRWLSQPLLDLDRLHHRQDSVACVLGDGLMRATLRQELGRIGDMERVVNRVMQGVSVATPRDLANLRQALRALPIIIDTIGEHEVLYQPEDDQELSGPRSRHPVPPGGQQPPGIEQPRTGDQPVSPQQPPQQPARRTLPPRVAGNDLFGEVEATSADEPEPPAPVETDTSPPAPDAEPLPEPRQQAEQDTPADTAPPGAQSLSDLLSPCNEVLNLLEQAVDDDPPGLLGNSNYLDAEEEGERKPRRVIRPGYDQRIDQVVQASRDAQNYINSLEGRERERTGIKSLKVNYNKIFGYYLEVSRANSNQVPAHYERKQTLVNAERYVTAELKEYENVVLNAQQRLVEYERETFAQICATLSIYGWQLRATARALARLDVVASLAEVAARNSYTRPTLNESTALHISGGRHPVVERALEESFIPNDLQLDTEEQQILVITGPNMAGKSTILRQAALIILMAQIGSFVPAERAEIGLVDRIFTRIGAQDDIATGRSTFMVEMTETAALLMQSTRRSMIILDEVGRGTSTYDGMAIAQAVVEYLHNEPRLQCRTMFATHYHELTDLESVLPRVKNYHMAAIERDGRVVFLYQMRRGRADRSYGIHVAEIAGIPRPVIRRATELLAELESGKRTLPTTPMARPPEPAASEPKTAKGKPGGTNTAMSTGQRSLFDVAPDPVVEYLKRLNVNELSPIEALNKLYELQRIAQTPLPAENENEVE
jgi:DNA mismatch repair protein MutS